MLNCKLPPLLEIPWIDNGCPLSRVLWRRLPRWQKQLCFLSYCKGNTTLHDPHRERERLPSWLWDNDNPRVCANFPADDQMYEKDGKAGLSHHLTFSFCLILLPTTLSLNPRHIFLFVIFLGKPVLIQKSIDSLSPWIEICLLWWIH